MGLLLAGSAGAGPITNRSVPARLIARTYNSGFELAHDTYNGMGTGSDGKIYYVLSSESYETGAQMYCYDPATGKIKHLGDLTEACGEKDAKTIAQGKSPVTFVECKGKLYFATHIGYYSLIDGMEKIGIPPAGYKPYPGGHFLSYDMKTGEFQEWPGPAARGSDHEHGRPARRLRHHVAQRLLIRYDLLQRTAT
jgi:outer membrane protein assembly factor BamB